MGRWPVCPGRRFGPGPTQPRRTRQGREQGRQPYLNGSPEKSVNPPQEVPETRRPRVAEHKTSLNQCDLVSVALRPIGDALGERPLRSVDQRFIQEERSICNHEYARLASPRFVDHQRLAVPLEEHAPAFGFERLVHDQGGGRGIDAGSPLAAELGAHLRRVERPVQREPSRRIGGLFRFCRQPVDPAGRFAALFFGIGMAAGIVGLRDAVPDLLPVFGRRVEVAHHVDQPMIAISGQPVSKPFPLVLGGWSGIRRKPDNAIGPLGHVVAQPQSRANRMPPLGQHRRENRRSIQAGAPAHAVLGLRAVRPTPRRGKGDQDCPHDDAHPFGKPERHRGTPSRPRRSRNASARLQTSSNRWAAGRRCP